MQKVKYEGNALRRIIPTPSEMALGFAAVAASILLIELPGRYPPEPVKDTRTPMQQMMEDSAAYREQGINRVMSYYNGKGKGITYGQLTDALDIEPTLSGDYDKYGVRVDVRDDVDEIQQTVCSDIATRKTYVLVTVPGKDALDVWGNLSKSGLANRADSGHVKWDEENPEGE